MTAVIDAHLHFWRLAMPFDFGWLERPEHAPIRRDFLPGDLRPEMEAAGVHQGVFVQTQHSLEETRWALALADENPWIAGVVGWVDLASKECDRQVTELRRHAKFVGVRHLAQDEEDDNWLVRAEVLQGLRVLERHGVPFDLLLHVRHLPHAQTLGMAFPSLPLVIDHLAKPDIRGGRMDGWLPALKNASRCRNVHVKLSGLVTEADWRRWKPADLKPYVQAALDLFGPERCLFGSDWPVCLLASPYGRVKSTLEEALGPLDEEARHWVFGGAARKFYGLDRR
jgi:L-fuconolactonase